MAQAAAKGDLALTIDELGLEASLRFTPDQNGAEWSADKLLRLVMDSRLGGVTPRRAEDILSKFSRSRGPVVEVLAKGLPPEEAVPEEADWEELNPDPGLEAVVAATIAEAQAPELFKIRVETIKTETTVKKPGALPFLPPKIEKVVGQEKREIKEAIYPDPTVVFTGFAKRGCRLGLLSSSKAGKQGKSIFGKPIAPEGKDTAFILGRGVSRAKSELLAEYDGVVRAGDRWVEVIPIPLASYTLSRSPDGATWFLNFNPGDARLPIPDAEAIHKAALDQGADPATIIDSAAIGAILAEATAAGEALFSCSISLDRDGRAEVVVDPDGLKAVLNVWKARGRGRPLTLADVTAALKAGGVRIAKPEQLKKDIPDFYKSDAPELLGYVLAEGKAPTRGKDRTVALTAAFLADERAAELKAKLAASPALSSLVPSLGDFPIEGATKVAQVQAGQRFGELSAQGIGQPGVDLKGLPLPGIPGNDPRIKTYENVDFVKGLLSASAAGVLLVREGEGSWDFRVLPFKDSSIEVTLSPDSMEAYINLQAEHGLGKPLTMEAILEALKAKGVVQGLDPRAVSEAMAAARAGQVVLRRLVARGKPALAAGSPRRFWLIGAATPFEGQKPSGPGPFHVVAGMKVLRVEKAAGASQAGTDVLGRPVQASSAPEAAITQGKALATGCMDHDGTIRESVEEGSIVYTAGSGGELKIGADSLTVIERFDVQGDIGASTGNVRFAGPVHVHGAVRRGFQLFAGGDATISGAVEAAIVSSEGIVTIGGGMRGERRGTIRAKRSVDLAFAEQALILAVEDIRVRGSAALCSFKTNGRLIVGSERGSLVGGLSRARKGVEASILGSENGIKTEISFGQDYLVADMIEAEEKEIEKLKLLIVQSDRAMAEAQRIGTGLDQSRQDKVKLVKLLERRSIRLFDLREKFEEHFPASEVKVRGMVYPGVILESHNRFYEVRSRKSNVVFTFDQQQGRIVERQL